MFMIEPVKILGQIYQIPGDYGGLQILHGRGDQIQNAQSFERQGFSKVLDQETLTDDILLTSILDVYANRQKYIDRMAEMDHTKGVERIMDIINEYAKP
jgi:UDP-N-acetylglucosamine--N-acetylmuramyl-(pentapeptide) pyrophosphoryl-undecaprenol N-acetylglucosamine transferase